MPSDWRTFFPLGKTSVRGGEGGRGARRSLKGIGEVVRVCIRVGARFGETSNGGKGGGLCLICGVRS